MMWGLFLGPTSSEWSSTLSAMVTSSGLPSLSSLSIHLHGGARGRGRQEGANVGDYDIPPSPTPTPAASIPALWIRSPSGPPPPAHHESADLPASKTASKPAQP